MTSTVDPMPAGSAPAAPIGAEPPVADALDALEAAMAAIAAELSVERVLQVIVDRVRPLVGARYAALGIVDEAGVMERFITSGIDDAARRAIGHTPLGHGLLGLIVRERVSVRVPDVMTDPRRHGFPQNHPPMHSFLGVPVIVESESVGNLYLTEKLGAPEFSDQDQRLVEMFARHAGIAIHNARLHAQVQLLAVLSERERIGKDLHDGVIQELYGVGLSLEDMPDLMADDPAEAAARVERAIESIHGAIRDIRSFIFGLGREELDDVDLAAGLLELADQARRASALEVLVDADPTVQPPAEDAIQVLQIAREALSNAARHAAASRVVVVLSREGHTVRLSIADDGQGFEPTAWRAPGHHGLGNMRARAEALGARFTIESRPGSGTRLELLLTLAATHQRRPANGPGATGTTANGGTAS